MSRRQPGDTRMHPRHGCVRRPHDRYVRFLGRRDLRHRRARRWCCSCWRCWRPTGCSCAPTFASSAAQDPELKRCQRIGDRIGARSNLVIGVEGPDPARQRALRRSAGRATSAAHRHATCAPSTTAPTPPRPSSSTTSPSTPIWRICGAPTTISRSCSSRKKNPAFVAFADSDLGEEEDDPARDLERLKRTSRSAAATARFPNGYYESEDRPLLAIVTWTSSSGTGDLSGFAIRDDVQRVIDETQPGRFGKVTRPDHGRRGQRHRGARRAEVGHRVGLDRSARCSSSA